MQGKLFLEFEKVLDEEAKRIVTEIMYKYEKKERVNKTFSTNALGNFASIALHTALNTSVSMSIKREYLLCDTLQFFSYPLRCVIQRHFCRCAVRENQLSAVVIAPHVAFAATFAIASYQHSEAFAVRMRAAACCAVVVYASTEFHEDGILAIRYNGAHRAIALCGYCYVCPFSPAAQGIAHYRVGKPLPRILLYALGHLVHQKVSALRKLFSDSFQLASRLLNVFAVQ